MITAQDQRAADQRAADQRAADQLLPCPARPGGTVVGDQAGPQWIDGGARFWYVEFAALGGYWHCRLDDYTCEPTGCPPPGNPPEVVSPDGRVAVSRRGHDLWARSLSDGRRWALTTDGTPDHPYGTGPYGTGPTGSAGTTPLHEPGLPHLPPAVVWSPDSTRVLTHRTDERRTRRTHPVAARPTFGGVPAVPSQRCAPTGDGTGAQAELVVLDVDNGTAVRA
ncbi:beta-propeller domain-containing protein [Kitasatospora purpeofusca]|uniref:hypothetical protein n=1 Tax=Kitasatospora purpeofusca TaxID=67352 RepID=UPI00368B9466